MTYNEALERAKKIWGNNVQVVRASNYQIPGKTEWNAHWGNASIWHGMDCNGHPTCHFRCMKIEEGL